MPITIGTRFIQNAFLKPCRRKKKSGNAIQKTRKKREELSISATKSIKREEVEIVVEFN